MTLELGLSDQFVGRRHSPASTFSHPCRPGPTNSELIDGCLSSDVGSWNELVSRYERLVYAIPLREGLSSADAAEVSQSTFETLIESLDRIRDPERLGYWLMTVARRLTWRQRLANEAEVTMSDMPHDGVVDEQADDWARTVAVYDAVAGLREPCRALVFGLFFDPAEPTYDQLSTTLGVAIGSIGPMRSRCLDQLRDRLQS